MLHDRFEVEHTTLQLDYEGGELLEVEMPEQREPSTRDEVGSGRDATQSERRP